MGRLYYGHMYSLLLTVQERARVYANWHVESMLATKARGLQPVGVKM